MPRSFSRTVLVIASLSLTTAALAADGGADPRADAPAAAPDPAYLRALAEVKAGRFATAIPLLADVVARDPMNADAFNNLGYSHRKLGQREQALTYYAEALRLDPKHVGALEYQGELFLELSDLPRAEANLDLLGQLCGRCETYEDLAAAVVAYKAKPKT